MYSVSFIILALQKAENAVFFKNENSTSLHSQKESVGLEEPAVR